MNSSGEWARKIWTVLVNEPERYEQFWWMSQKGMNNSGEWARKIWTVLVNEPDLFMNNSGEWARKIWLVLVNEPERYEQFWWMSQKCINSSEWASKIWIVLVNEPERYEHFWWMIQKCMNSSGEWARKTCWLAAGVIRWYVRCGYFSCYTAILTINVPVVYMVRYKVVLRGDYP